jgi:hypothetical protein
LLYYKQPRRRTAPFAGKEYPPRQRPASFSLDQIRTGVDGAIDESFKKRGVER